VTLTEALLFAIVIGVLEFFWARFSRQAGRVPTVVVAGILQALLLDVLLVFRWLADAGFSGVSLGWFASVWPLAAVDLGLAAGIAAGVLLRRRTQSRIKW
jgi:hypothetical protein